jgi:hypothetical protein
MIDAAPAKTKVPKPGKDLQTIDVNSIRNKDVHEVEAFRILKPTWICVQSFTKRKNL